MKIFSTLRSFGLLFILIISSFACSGKTGNPLLDATDGQFILVSSGGCLSFLMTSEKLIGDDLRGCPKVVQETAAFAGIPNVVTLEHIKDPRVKERYLALKKK